MIYISNINNIYVQLHIAGTNEPKSAPCLACWAPFGWLVPAMRNHTSCAQVHELPQSRRGDNREGTLFSW